MSREFPKPPQHTPTDVLCAVHKLAAHAATRGYGSIVVTPGGGASFRLDNVIEREGELLSHLAAVMDERDALAAEVAELRAGKPAMLPGKVLQL